MNPSRIRQLVSLLTLVLALVPISAQEAPPAVPSAAPTAAASPLLGHWEGAVEVPGAALLVKIDLSSPDGGRFTGTIDIPQQGAKGLALTSIEIGATEAKFSIQGVPGNPTFSAKLEGEELRGTFSQGGANLPFKLGRTVAPPPARPQLPKEPFPYTAEEVSFENGAIRLAGTLTIPAGDGPFPAAILLTGSGAQDRDETLFDHKLFLVIADHLSRAGIAVLRLDDRGVGGSTGNLFDATEADLAGDGLAAAAFLRKQARIQPERIGFIGHSEGGITGPLAATKDPRIAFVVMLAGTGLPGHEVLLDQIRTQYLLGGYSGEKLEAAVTLARERLALMAGDEQGVQYLVRVRENLTKARDLELGGTVDSPEERKAWLDAQVFQANSPWLRSFLRHDPRPVLRQLKTPVLAMIGSLDRQVGADLNLPEIEKALRESKHPDATVLRVEGVNHLFQTAATGHGHEYATIEETIQPKVLETMTRWLLARLTR